MSLKEIRGRISSVKNTQQITKAMKMVSAAKLRKAQDKIVNLRPYATSILQVIADLAVTQKIDHPLLSPVKRPSRALLVIVTSDRGLCGGFNTNVSKHAMSWYNKNKDAFEVLDLLFVGRKAADYFKVRRYPEPKRVILNLAKDISYELAAEVATQLMDAFLSGGYDEIRFIYNEFKSAIAQELVDEMLLPIDLSQSTFNKETSFAKDFIFEPDAKHIIDDLLHKHFAVQVYRAMSESVAAEHAARMTAMENATNNASDMIKGLTLTYNKLRQAAITTELTEISSGAEALKG